MHTKIKIAEQFSQVNTSILVSKFNNQYLHEGFMWKGKVSTEYFSSSNEMISILKTNLNQTSWVSIKVSTYSSIVIFFGHFGNQVQLQVQVCLEGLYSKLLPREFHLDWHSCRCTNAIYMAGITHDFSFSSEMFGIHFFHTQTQRFIIQNITQTIWCRELYQNYYLPLSHQNLITTFQNLAIMLIWVDQIAAI